MNHAACLLAITLLAASSAFAQASSSSSSGAPRFAPAPPPPGMNDPGVRPGKMPAAASTRSRAVSSPAALEPSMLPGKPIPTPNVAGAAGPREANAQPSPDVSVRQEGENTIQEYRQNGRVYRVVVTPKYGPQQIYNVDPNSYMFNPATRSPIKPVEYRVLEWGKSKPASASSTQDNGN